MKINCDYYSSCGKKGKTWVRIGGPLFDEYYVCEYHYEKYRKQEERKQK